MLSIRVRLLAFLIDLSLGHILFYCQPDFFSRLYPSFLVGENNMLFMLLIPTFIIRFYGTLLGGVSPGQWLCSLEVRPEGGRGRLLGGVRVFSEIAGIPLFFIFQWPLLWGRETLGERVSGTRLHLQPQASLPFQLLMVTIFGIISLLVPIFQYFIFSDQLDISFFRQGLNPTDFSKSATVNIYSSNRFGFQTRSILNEERFILLPDFEVIKIKNKKKIRPFLIIYDRHNKKMGQFKLDRKVDFLSILEKGRWGNPLFQHDYPLIGKLLNRDRQAYRRMPYLEKYDGNPLIDVKTQKEIEFFIEEVFSTKIPKIWFHLITRGPFVRGYWKVKESLLNLVPSEVQSKIFLFSFGDQKFLRFRQIYSMLEYPLRDTYMPIGTKNAMIFHIMWEDGSQKMNDIFLKKFFYSTKWYFDFDNVFSFPVDENRLTPFHIIDYFTLRNINENQRKALENHLIKFCYFVSKEAVLTGDRRLEALLLNIFDRYRFVAQTEYLGVRKEFILQLNAIQKALKLQEREFFERR